MNKLLLSARVTYWYNYTDRLHTLHRFHLGASIWSVGTLTLFFIMWSLILATIGQQYYDYLKLLNVGPIICFIMAIFTHYIVIIKDKRYLKGLHYLEEFPIEEHKRKCIEHSLLYVLQIFSSVFIFIFIIANMNSFYPKDKLKEKEIVTSSFSLLAKPREKKEIIEFKDDLYPLFADEHEGNDNRKRK